MQRDREREREIESNREIERNDVSEMILNLHELVEIVVEIDVMRHDYAVVRQNCVRLDLLSRANRQLCLRLVQSPN